MTDASRVVALKLEDHRAAALGHGPDAIQPRHPAPAPAPAAAAGCSAANREHSHSPVLLQLQPRQPPARHDLAVHLTEVISVRWPTPPLLK